MDTTRFLSVIKWSLLTYKKQHIRNFLSMAVIYFLFLAVNTTMLLGYPMGITPDMLAAGAHICVIAYCIATIALAANSFAFLKDKHARSQYLMLPATNLEKYLARIVIFILESTVLLFASFVVADLLQMVISYILAHDAYSAIPAFFADIMDFNGGHLYAPFLVATVWVSSYILGSTFFSKNSLVYTTLAWATLSVLMVTILGGLGVYIVKNIEWLENIEIDWWFSDEVMNVIFDVAGNAIMICVIMFNFWFSYRIFRKMNVVVNKFTNL